MRQSQSGVRGNSPRGGPKLGCWTVGPKLPAHTQHIYDIHVHIPQIYVIHLQCM